MAHYPVFDKGNPDRLLGYYRTSGFVGKGVELMLALPYDPNEDLPQYHHIFLETSFKSETISTEEIDEITVEITSVTRTCFLTKAPLEYLMEMRSFRLPGSDLL